MDLQHNYKTIRQPAEGTYSASGSKFIAYLYGMSDETGIKTIKERLKKDHPKAVHVVFASRIGIDNTMERSADDGEPAGSAGKPVLNVLKSNSLTNCAIFVVRYFGGKKLGIPGLIHAYAGAATAAVENAVVEITAIKQFYKILCNISHLQTVIHVISQAGASIHEITYEKESCNFIINFNRDQEISILSKLKSLWQIQLEYLESK
ncbi:MAG: YigZ family protein [Chitinophagales bacterium]|nr:YigZ family protein [Chitinophagales bacterium]